MANIALTTANRVEVVGIPISQFTVPAEEAVVAGGAARFAASGMWTNSNGTTTTEANTFGIFTRSCAARETVTCIRKGILDGYDLSALAFGDKVYLSDTDGRLSTTAGTVSKVIGVVVPGTASTLGTAYKKLLFVDL